MVLHQSGQSDVQGFHGGVQFLDGAFNQLIKALTFLQGYLLGLMRFGLPG